MGKIVIDKKRNVYFKKYLLKVAPKFDKNQKRPLIVICPGGGYFNISEREAEPIALRYNAAGFHAVVVNYGINEHAKMPGPIRDLAKVMLYVNEYSDEWNVDSSNIFVTGFSAGGHLAAALSVFWNSDTILPEFSEVREQIKPKGVILGYPVIDLKETQTHDTYGIDPNIKLADIQVDLPNGLQVSDVYFEEEGRVYFNFEVYMNSGMAGKLANDDFVNQYSLNKQVTKDACPTFIWHTQKDKLIYPANALKFAQALEQNKIDYELHIYPEGGHGLSLANELVANDDTQIVPSCQGWIDEAIRWINQRSIK